MFGKNRVDEEVQAKMFFAGKGIDLDIQKRRLKLIELPLDLIDNGASIAIADVGVEKYLLDQQDKIVDDIIESCQAQNDDTFRKEYVIPIENE